jgi:hypothetical protein
MTKHRDRRGHGRHTDEDRMEKNRSFPWLMLAPLALVVAFLLIPKGGSGGDAKTEEAKPESAVKAEEAKPEVAKPGTPVQAEAADAPDVREAPAKAAPAAASPAIRVRAVHPQVGADLAVSVQQPADVAPYYRADLFPTVSGTIEFLQKDIGHAVVKGEVVARIKPLPGQPSDAASCELRAPFDGVVASRAADPGTFVASAALVPGAMPVVTIVRADIVTVGMRVPDTVAALVDTDTAAEIRLDGVSGEPIRCNLTRIAPALGATDRTRRVEVDLWNGTAASFEAFKAESARTDHADLKGRDLPQLPRGLAEGASARLLPGMYGQMRLTVKRFEKLPLVPSSAIVRRGGMPFLFRVEDGVARLRPVGIDIDDGTMAAVVWMEKDAGQQVRRPLRTDELIVASNQGELEDGSRVQAQDAAR